MLAELSTEQRNSSSENIDCLDALAICDIINREDAKVAQAVSRCLPVIANVIDGLVPRLRSGGRVVYVGAGTSGRLGVLDSSEIPPTFSVPYGQFIGLMAGGETAIRNAVEGAEDSTSLPITDLEALEPPLNGNLDSLIGITASGRTPYVLAAMRYARGLGCFTIGICCSAVHDMRESANYVISCPVGAEVVTGSTRMKSGTAQKMILNMISTTCQIKLGKTYGNLMIDVKTSNVKLKDRARRIFRNVITTLPGNPLCSRQLWSNERIDKLLDANGNSVKQSVVAARWDCRPEEAHSRLVGADGVLREAL